MGWTTTRALRSREDLLLDPLRLSCRLPRPHSLLARAQTLPFAPPRLPLHARDLLLYRLALRWDKLEHPELLRDCVV